MPVSTIIPGAGGWNLRDHPLVMEPTDCVALVNWIPRPYGLVTRGGFDALLSVTGATADYRTHTIIDYPSSTTPIGIVATHNTAAGTGILWKFDELAGTFTSLKTSTGWRWNYTHFQDKLILVDGAHNAQVFDGTSVVDLNITTGPAEDTLWGALTFKGRVYYWQRNARSFWYAAAGSFQGTLTEYDLSTFTTSGGFLISMQRLTLDGGQGADDLAAFIFSTGEVLVYQGDDPADTNSWQLLGRFMIGQPNGIRGFATIGGSPVAVNSNGVVDLTKAIFSSSGDQQAIIGKIGKAVFNSFVLNSAARNGYAQSVYAQNDQVLWLARWSEEQDDPSEYQGLCGMATDTSAWFAVNGISWSEAGLGGVVCCIGTIGGRLYIGYSGGAISKYNNDSGYNTLGTNGIVGTILMAYSGQGANQMRKHVTAVDIESDYANKSFITASVKTDFSATSNFPGGVVRTSGSGTDPGAPAYSRSRKAVNGYGRFIAIQLDTVAYTRRQIIQSVSIHWVPGDGL